MMNRSFTRGVVLTVLLACAFLSAAALGWTASPAAVTLAPVSQQPTPGGYTIFLPSVIGGEESLALPPEAELVCELTPEEQALADLMRSDPGQQRPSLTCNPILVQVARERAEDLGRRNYFDHVNPDGYGPNYLVQAAGYTLPDWYYQEPEANNIESLAGGFSSAQLAWDALLDSESHRIHVLGEDPFFQEQIEFGIGYTFVENSQYQYYWVILTARH